MSSSHSEIPQDWLRIPSLMGLQLPTLSCAPMPTTCFVDAKRERVYVSCGDGHLDVFDARGNAYRRIGHLVTQLGARTSLFVPELNLLFIAARATSSEPAAIWVFRSSDANNESLQ